MMKYFFLLFMILANQAIGQKLKFKLVFKDSTYEGTMSPKWFEKVQLKPLGENHDEFDGAKGMMEGERFGKMAFSIAQNETGTSEKFMIKTNNGWYPITRLKQKESKLWMAFNWGFRPSPRSIDLVVLKRANELLGDTTSWNKVDDRMCDDDFSQKRWSLYCVLKQAYLDETDDFNHRAPALNIIREYISSLNPKRKYDHQVMDFNNEQGFSEVKKVLRICIEKMESLLNL